MGACRPRVQRVQREPDRFFDGGEVGEPPDRDGPLRIVLERHVDGGVESFSLRRAVGYDDRRLGSCWCRPTPGSGPT